MKCTRESHKIEFSKKLLIVAMFINIIVIGFSIILMWRTADLSPLAYLLPAVAAEVAAGTGFYYWKAKAENKCKHALRFVAEIAEKYGIEAAVQMASSIITD